MSAYEKREGADPCTITAPVANLADASIAAHKKIHNPEVSKFLDLIAEGEEVTFQTFDDKKGPRDPQLTRILHGTLDEHLSLLMRLNESGAGIFFTVNKTDLQGRETHNITKVRAVFIDLDGAPLEPVIAAPLEPHIVIESSPKRYHAYWLIEGLALEEFTKVQEALSKCFNSDPALKDLPRVMRLPGFYHRKGNPFLVRTISTSGTQPYKKEHFLKSFVIDLIAEEGQVHPSLGLSNDVILQALHQRGMIKRPLPNKAGGWDILCPFTDLHTTGNEGTAYFEAHTNGYKGSGFKCQHAHCIDKSIEDLKKYLGLQVVLKEEEKWENPTPLLEELQPVMAFDDDMLPDQLRPWIKDIAERMQVPVDFLASAMVVVLGSLIGRKVGIFPKAQDDWLVIPNLWGAIVGRPSLLKSPAIAEIMKPLDELAAHAIVKYKDDMKLYEQQREWHEAQKSARKDILRQEAKKKQTGLKKMPALDNLEPPSEPHPKRYRTEDATVEKIGEILLQNPQGILMHRDELVGWFKGLEKYGHEGDRAFYLESWNGSGTYTVDRIGRGTLHIPALCLSIIGGIQPGPLRQYVHDAVAGGSGDDGLLQRFQLSVWPDVPTEWKNIDRLPNSEFRQQAYHVFKKFDSFVPFEPAVEGACKTYGLHFSDEAQQQFDDWRLALEKKLRSGELSPPLESHFAKYRSLMPSLALIFCLVDSLEHHRLPLAVDLHSTLRAIKWCQYLETHARRLYASATNLGMESAIALLNRIRKGDLRKGEVWEFSIRDVYHKRHWSKLDSVDKVAAAVKILEEFGWVRIEEIGTRGRPVTRIHVHPSLKKVHKL